MYSSLIGENVFKGQLGHLLTNLQGLFTHCIQELLVWDGLCLGSEYDPVGEGFRVNVVFVGLITLSPDEPFVLNLDILQIRLNIVDGLGRLDELTHFGVQENIISK